MERKSVVLTTPLNSSRVPRLPSLDFALSNKSEISSAEFVGRTPTVPRGFHANCFNSEEDEAVIDMLFDRSALRTPPEIRDAVLREKKENERRSQLRKERKAERRAQRHEALRAEVYQTRVAFSTTTSFPTRRASQVTTEEFRKKLLDSNQLNVHTKAQTSVAPQIKPAVYHVPKSEPLPEAVQAQFFFSEEDKMRKLEAFDVKRQELMKRKEKAKERSLRLLRQAAVKTVDSNVTPRFDGEMHADELKSCFHQYFGEQSVNELNELFHEALNDLTIYTNEDELPVEKQSPRHLFLREQAKSSLNPLPLILRDEKNPRGVFLANRGLGDDRVLPVVSVLDLLPAVWTIDLCDNRLTDKSLMPLALKLNSLVSLTHLDLSFNKIDESSGTIMEYLRSRTCKLRVFLLNGADVDDGECENLMEAIIDNHTIQTLGLAKNLIGKNEMLNIINPDLVTGGEAIATMLVQNITVKHLDLSWNAIRLASAESVGLALEINKTLVSLNLAHNTFGDLGTQLIGRSLKTNRTLRELDLSFNSVTPASTSVLTNALSGNDSLTLLNLTGNIIGRVGLQGVVAAIQRSAGESRLLKILFDNCDCMKLEPELFNAANPNGRWVLDLTTPYGQMVAAECLFLANNRPGCNIVRLDHGGHRIELERKKFVQDKGKFSIEDFQLICLSTARNLLAERFEEAADQLQLLLYRQFQFHFDGRKAFDLLKLLHDNWLASGRGEHEELSDVLLFEVFHTLFLLNDVNRSNTMEIDEFAQTLRDLGKTHLEMDQLRRLMGEHDLDDSGTIDANEFAMIMVNKFCGTEVPRGQLVDKSTGFPWVVPDKGLVIIEMRFECDLPNSTDVGRDEGLDGVVLAIHEAKSPQQKYQIFEQAVNSPYFFLNAVQAQMLYDEVSEFTKDPVQLMGEILPQLINPEACNQFLDDNLDENGKLELRVKLGPLYMAYVGMPTGHYLFDLKNSRDLKGGKRLAALSVAEGKAQQALGANTSQKGTHSSFRNEQVNERYVAVTGAWFASCPQSGTMRFDFVSTSRPRQGTKPLSDARYIRFKARLALDELADIMKQWHANDDDDPYGDNSDLMSSCGYGVKAQSKDPLRVPRASTAGANQPQQSTRATKIVSTKSDPGGGTTSDSDGAAAARASSSAKKSRKSQRTKTIKPAGTTNLFTPIGAMEAVAESVVEAPVLPKRKRTPPHGVYVTPPLTIVHVKEQFSEYIESSHHYHDIYPSEKQRTDVKQQRSITPEELSLGPKPSTTYIHPIYGPAYRKLLELQLLLPSVYFSVAQVWDLMTGFPSFGYLRVQLLQAVFSHIVDLENLWQITDSLMTEDERTEAGHRIGILNLFDPVFPDRFYKLDLRRWDHREMAKVLVELAVAEPGENWVGESFRWSKYDEPVPGWGIPASWTLADEEMEGEGGPRRHGWLLLLYTSEGEGCLPNYAARKNLRRKTLVGMKRLL